MNKETAQGLEPHVCKPEDWVLQPGRDSSSTAESRYGCPICDKGEFRGGWGSSLWLEKSIVVPHKKKSIWEWLWGRYRACKG